MTFLLVSSFSTAVIHLFHFRMKATSKTQVFDGGIYGEHVSLVIQMCRVQLHNKHFYSILGARAFHAPSSYSSGVGIG